MLLFVALLVGCSSEQEVGHRFRAEQGLYQADQESRGLVLRGQDSTPEQWEALAGTYESVAAKSKNVPTQTAEVEEEIQTIRARALFGAARAYALSGDSLRVAELFEGMAVEFGQLSAVAAEVALARAGLAEGRGDILAAADHYQLVVDTVEPSLGRSDAAGMVLELPLRIARLHARSAPEADALPQYANARKYYERYSEDDDEFVRAEALGRLAESSADMGDWDRAAESLNILEEMLLGLEAPPREPAAVRFAFAQVKGRAGGTPEEIRDILTALLEDYPQSVTAKDALFLLADNAVLRGEPDEALGHLERLHDQNKADPDVGSAASLARARLLEREDRWKDASQAFTALAVEYPISQAALIAPLEIAGHFQRVGDTDGVASALSRAESEYRGFIDRYPPGPMTLFANERLVQTLALQKEYDSAIGEMLDLSERLAGTPKGVALLIDAAKLAYEGLADTTRAADILDKAGGLYGHLDVGKWASNEATRLRETLSP